MLSKPYRLPGHCIPCLIKSSLRFDSPAITLKIRSSNQSTPRFGFMVSSKIAKSAVARNKIKRVLRKSAQTIFPHLKPGHDLLIIAKQPTLKSSASAIHSEMVKIIQQTGLYK